MPDLREPARDRQHRGDTRRVVEGRAEPPVVVRTDDERRRRALAGEVADDVVARGVRGQLDVEHEAHRGKRAVAHAAAEVGDVFPAQRDHRRRLRVPVGVERSQRSLTLVVRAAGRQLSTTPTAPRSPSSSATSLGLTLAVAQSTSAMQPSTSSRSSASPLARADVEQAGDDSPGRRRRHAAHRGRLVGRAAVELERGVQEPPAVDRHALDRDVREPDLAHLAGHELGDRPILGRPGRAEPERARPDRAELLDDPAEVGRARRQPPSNAERVGRAHGPRLRHEHDLRVRPGGDARPCCPPRGRTEPPRSGG